MSLNCTEKFLENVTDVYVYASSDLSIPLPFSIPNIKELTFPSLPSALLHLSKSASDGVECTSITIKENASVSAFPHRREQAVSAVIEQDTTRVRDAYSNIVGKDCFVVFVNECNEKFFIYSLPATFGIEYNETVENSLSLEMKMQSLSSFIKMV